jgi:hypothetical protein
MALTHGIGYLASSDRPWDHEAPDVVDPVPAAGSGGPGHKGCDRPTTHSVMQECVGCAKLEVEPGADAMVGATLVASSVRGLVHAATTADTPEWRRLCCGRLQSAARRGKSRPSC